MDESTYWARVKRIDAMMSFWIPATVSDSGMADAVELVRSADPAVTSRKLERARWIKDAVVNPDTGERIPILVGLPCLLPFTVVANTLLLSAKGYYTKIGAHVLNQVYTCGHHYGCKNASNPQSTDQAIDAYVAAVFASVGAAVGVHRWLEKHLDKWTPGNRWTPVAQRLVPFGAVAAGTFMSIGAARKDERQYGIKIYDDNGDELGLSRSAGQLGRLSCLGLRILSAAPTLVIPALVMHKLESTSFYSRWPYFKTPTLMVLLGYTIQFSVPLALGICKQQASVDVLRLETEFHNRLDRFGNPVTVAHYNKGI